MRSCSGGDGCGLDPGLALWCLPRVAGDRVSPQGLLLRNLEARGKEMIIETGFEVLRNGPLDPELALRCLPCVTGARVSPHLARPE